MENLRIEATETTPLISCNAASGDIEMSGRSIPEDASAFYFPVLDWLAAYGKNPATESHFTFYLEYINSISQKMLIDIFLYVKELKNQGKNIRISWLYDEEDEEMRDEGEVFKSKLQLPIELIAKPEEN